MRAAAAAWGLTEWGVLPRAAGAAAAAAGRWQAGAHPLQNWLGSWSLGREGRPGQRHRLT